jgi:hypothetical protein
MKSYCMVIIFIFERICVWEIVFSTLEAVCYKVNVNVLKWWHSNVNAFDIQLHSSDMACLTLPCIVYCVCSFFKIKVHHDFQPSFSGVVFHAMLCKDKPSGYVLVYPDKCLLFLLTTGLYCWLGYLWGYLQQDANASAFSLVFLYCHQQFVSFFTCLCKGRFLAWCKTIPNGDYYGVPARIRQ